MAKGAPRDLIRPVRPGSKPATRSLRRRQTPPDQTNAEEYYYLKQMAAKTAMVLVLKDGQELRGSIEWYDKGSIKLTRDQEPSLLILKHDIRYMFKEKERKRQRRRQARAADRAADERQSE